MWSLVRSARLEVKKWQRLVRVLSAICGINARGTDRASTAMYQVAAVGEETLLCGSPWRVVLCRLRSVSVEWLTSRRHCLGFFSLNLGNILRKYFYQSYFKIHLKTPLNISFLFLCLFVKCLSRNIVF